MHTIDIIIVIAYLALCILIGLYKSKSIKTLKEYALGKGSFSDIVIITTLFATDIGAGSVMGSISKVYTLGMFFIVTRLVSPLFWLIMAQIYGRNIDQFYGCISISDIMEKLYGQVGRWMTNIAAIFASIGVVALQATAMGYLVNYFFNIGYLYSVIISVLILSIYSAFGGTRAIAMTDVFQFAILMIAIPIACSFAYHDVGGYSGIVNGLPNEMLQLDLNKENILLFLSLVFFSFMPETGGTYIHRFLISKNSIQLVKCMRIVALINIPFTLIICLIGLIIGIKAPDINPNTAFVYFVTNYMSVGIKGLIVAGLLAVIMSTADSWLNTTSVLVTHDIIRKIIPLTEKQALLIVKISTFLISIFAIILAINEKGIMEICWLTPNIWCPLITVPLSVGFLKFRTTTKAFVTASITGITFAFISGYIVGDLATVSLMCGMIGSAVGLFSMHYWQVHQGTLNINTQPTKLINTNINENANIDSKIALAESQGRHMFEDVEEQTKTIADELRKQSFIQGVEKGLAKGRLEGKEEVARNLLLQGFEIGIIESATGLSREDLTRLEHSIKIPYLLNNTEYNKVS